MNGDSQSREKPAQPDKPGSTIALPSLTEQPGTRIGRYKLLQQIGEGGCGVVYMAEQSEPVKRKVALKVIKLGMDTRQVVARFEAERQALAIMDHPNIAKVLDGGATDTGRPFFVMEMVRGIRITDYCDREKLSTRERLELFIQVCAAIQHAHQKGIIHRDIKPSNVLVTLDTNHKAMTKVIDFGIAKATGGQQLTDKTLFTAVEQFMGTPAYMSPEQADMAGLDIDTRTDIYSLGVLLYELITGKTPFDTAQLLASGLDSLRQTLHDQEPTTPSMRLQTLTPTDLTQVAGRHHTDAPKLLHAVRGDLDWIILKCLEKDRARRYETANGIAMDIHRHMNNEPVTARPPSRLYRFGKMVRRNKVAFTAVNSVALAIAIGFGVSTRLYLQEKTARADALAQKQQADEQRGQAINAKAEAEQQRDAATQAKAEADQQRDRATAASEETRQTVRNLQIRSAHTAFDTGRPADGLAWLATLLRSDPENRTVGSWIVSALSEHNFVLPAAPPITVKAPTIQASRMDALCFSPDGTRVAMGGANRFAQVFDVATSQPVTPPLPHEGEVKSVCFSPDGAWVVSASADRTVRVWNAATGDPVGAPLRHEQGVLRVQFSPDGALLVSADWQGQVKVWDGRSFELITEAIRHSQKINDLDFSPDGRLLATASEGDGAQLWHLPKGLPLGTRLKTFPAVNAIRFSREGDRVFTGANNAGRTERTGTARWESWHLDGKPVTNAPSQGGPPSAIRIAPFGGRMTVVSGTSLVNLWNDRTGAPLLAPLHVGSASRAVQFSPEGLRLFTASVDGSLRLWDVRSGQMIAEPFLIPGLSVLDGMFSPSGDLVGVRRGIGTGGRNGGAQLFDGRPGRSLPVAFKHSGAGGGQNRRASVSPDGKRLLVWTVGPPVRILDYQTGKQLGVTMTNGTGSSLAEFSPDGSKVVTASYDGSVRVWDGWTGQLIGSVMRHDGPVSSAAFSPDSRQLATGGRDNTVRVWDVETGRALMTPVTQPGPVDFVRFSPDGKFLASGGNGVVMHEWRSGREIFQFRQDSLPGVKQGDFSPDGTRLVINSNGRRAHLLDARTGELLPNPLAHNSPVRSVSFSPNGDHILTSSLDGTAKLWDAATGQLATSLYHRDGGGLRVHFSRDGRRVLTGSINEGTVRVWDAATGQPLSVPLKHGALVEDANFTPDGQSVVTASRDGLIRIWAVPSFPAPPPPWLADLAEAVAGERVDAGGLFDGEKAPDLWTVRGGILEQPGDEATDPYLKWARWFFADRSTRTISAFSDLTVPEYIQSVMPLGSPALHEEVLRLSPTHRGAMTQITRYLRNTATPPPNAKEDADYLEAIAAGIRKRGAAGGSGAGSPGQPR